MNDTQLIIRPETKQDRNTTETLTRDAFWDVYHPGCSEHLILHRLRSASGMIPELNLVAEREGRIIGHGMATRAKIVSPGRRDEDRILCLGPLSVAPDCRKQGVGGVLIRAIVSRAKALGFLAVVLVGHPEYYGRFGFQCTRPWQIGLPGIGMIDELMLLELQPGSMSSVEGEFHTDPAFEVGSEEVEEFDRRFPFREKHITDTQLP